MEALALFAVALIVSFTAGFASARQAPCPPSWTPTFGSNLGLSSDVTALVVFDDGSGGGTALYAAGRFTLVGGLTANHIGGWDGSSWSAVGGGTNADVHALAIFDDGTGPALYAGGAFTSAGGVPASSIAKWDGSSWSQVGGGVDGIVRALTVFDDGS